ncbi:PorP/SprF family type IX secretion system membrane protein [Tenacibaculum sp. AHE15PA]|uniref:PorP/SprF family type IX secretion system membrane protein n=1 Tax=unclassified Tenacibaculum TaxID=2635139 RepID=UPI001C4E570F|nr:MULTISPECIES: PorP/SprF family type IX secretion system membrane protein [unclassified Tenacibaculum]QXP74031.1 PorP/SprF family type IX secretion system membrane protein [Tenacibaculum sp. AHE14PA]QXP75601.1 PorP/SprF family type IX secretion system membrane protein [Tenacibaculum sp. AHE15PA]
MIKKITLCIALLVSVFSVEAQLSDDAQQYNSFTSRNFMKFNRFLTVPTFSALRESKTEMTAIVRNSNVDFEDNPRLYVGTYSGKMRENVGAGVAIYQQEVGVFKDFGALINYAQRLKLNENLDLTFGFNFLYSRRSADAVKVNSTVPDPQVANFQDVPLVMLQPAVTLSFGKFDVGVFFENLVDFNLKTSETATSFGEKTFSAHAMYSYEFTYASGILEGADLRTLVMARKPGENEFSVGGNVILDLPKAGWVKAGYDKTYGISAGIGVNISDKLAVGFSYEKSTFAATNEIGLIYNFGKKSYTRERPTRRSGNVNVTLPERAPKKEYKNEEHNDLSDEIQTAQDSIDILNKKVDEVLRLLKNQPAPQKVIVPTPVENKVEEKDTSLRRRSDKPWRQSTITTAGSGGGGTMYYIVSDRYKNKENVFPLIDKWKRSDVEAKYIFEPNEKYYYVYIDRFAKEEDAVEKVEELTDKTRMFESDDKNDKSSIVIKKSGKDVVYVVKLTIGTSGESYKEPKTQPKARVRTMSNMQGVAPGYYLQVYVNGNKALADRNVDELRNDNIEAGYFINPTTGYMHTYIAKTETREEAIKLYNNNLNGSFYDRKTIVRIK